MRTGTGLLVAAAVAFALAALVWRPTGSAITYTPRPLIPATPMRVAFESGLDSLVVALDSLQSAVGSRNRERASVAFRSARARYKRVEGLVEYFAPGVAGLVNGPLPDDDGDAPPRPLGAPAAFQRVSDAIDGDVASARADVDAMRGVVTSLRSNTRFVSIATLDVLDATRLEIARVTTLGLAGAGGGVSTDALRESAESLEGMRSVLLVASASEQQDSSEIWVAIDSTLRNAALALRNSGDFEHLDRLTFIVRYAAPASRAVAVARASFGQRSLPRRRVWRDDVASVFDNGAFDASAYAPEYAPTATPALVALGRRLFFDPRLSGPQTRSCASCHDPAKAFTDGRPRAQTLTASAEATARNTPTLLNAALQPRLFADERAGSLEEQVALVLASAAEMQSSATLAAARVREDATYRAEFGKAFSGAPDSAVTELSVRVALAAYVRSLVALDSRFDRAVHGDSAALSPLERVGFTVFMGKAQCGTCHFAPLFSGTVPPAFTASEPEIIGVPNRAADHREPIDADPGRSQVDHIEQHRFAFKVPTLRNIALTAPYMHNGAFATLEQVVDFYDRGSGAGLRGARPVLTLSEQPLHLTGHERRALIAFLRALSDTSVVPQQR